MSMSRTLQGEQVAEVIRLYQSGLTAKEIGRRFQLTQTPILRILREANVVKPRGGGAWGIGRSVVQHDYFVEIMTEAQAYWLGFFSADGCIRADNTMSVSVAPVDIDHLETLRQDMGVGNKIGVYKNAGSGHARLQWSSPQMKQDFARLGVKHRKSWDIIPPVLPEIFQRHYWRGVFDGDGHISIRPNYTKHYLMVQLVGMLPMVEGFCQFCRVHTNAKINARPTQGHYQSGSMAGPATEIAALLYTDATRFLPRKMAVYQRWLRGEYGSSLAPREE